jgi:hypothetical protein
MKQVADLGVGCAIAANAMIIAFVTPKHPHCEFERRQWGGWRAGFIRTRRG